jgi:hypothetical protein
VGSLVLIHGLPIPSVDVDLTKGEVGEVEGGEEGWLEPDSGLAFNRQA